jgi:transposase InsO family protein
MDVSTSGYYAWLKREPSLRQVEDEKLLKLIRLIFESSRQTYGSPRIHATLQELGHKVAEKRVARIMQENGIVVRPSRAWRCVTTKSDPRNSVGVFRIKLMRFFQFNLRRYQVDLPVYN